MAYDFLLLRGLSREQGHWANFPDKLLKVSGVNSVHFVDLPGNGKYHRLTSPLTIREMAEFVQAHDPIPEGHEKVVLALSMGAMVTIELLSQYDQEYQAAFLINTSIAGLSPVHKRIKPFALETFYKVLRAKNTREREEHVLSMVSNFPEKRAEVLEAWTQIAHSRPTSHFNSLRQLLAASRYRLPPVKPQTPIYCLTSKGDRMVDYHCTMALSQKWSLPMGVHKEAGHELHLDAGDWVVENLEAWLKELKAEKARD